MEAWLIKCNIAVVAIICSCSLVAVADHSLTPDVSLGNGNTNGDDHNEVLLICPMGEFKCNNSDTCVEQRHNCDGIIHCEDGSDEWKCVDFQANDFYDHLFRKRPNAEIDKLQDSSCYFHGFNVSACECLGSTVTCAHKDLKNIPANLPETGMTVLDLTGNDFKLLDGNFSYNLENTEELVLRFCSITRIHPQAFKRFADLDVYVMHLNNNVIRQLPVPMFPVGNFVEELLLGSNQISSLDDEVFDGLEHLIELDLRHNLISEISARVFQPLKNLEKLFLNGNRISVVNADSLPQFLKLTTLSFADNNLISVKFGKLHSLRSLFLSGNPLREIKNGTFKHLSNLQTLFLNDNELIHFGTSAFIGLHNLTSLNMKNNSFKRLDDNILRNLSSLDKIYFSTFSLCRAALHVRVCEPHGDGISSVKHLLDSPVLRGSVWVMALIAVAGNALVLGGRLLTRGPHPEHSLYLRHLALSDLLMGVYLAAIATADIVYRGHYLKNDEQWRESIPCALCGFLSTLSCQSSTLLLTLVTWDRLISVTRPLTPRSPSLRRAGTRLAVLWLLAGSAAVAPLVGFDYFGEHFYGSNGVCLSIHIHDPYGTGWQYSVALFIVCNSLALIFITWSYIRMLRAIHMSAMSLRSTHARQEGAVARRFAIIVFTDCLCWVPIITVKIIALCGLYVSKDLYAWLAVFVLPVNSALNPILYTLTTAMFKQQIRKLFASLSCGTNEPSHSGFESAHSISLGYFPPGSKKRLLHRVSG